MTTLYPETHGEGGDTAAQTAAGVLVPRQRKARKAGAAATQGNETGEKADRRVSAQNGGVDGGHDEEPQWHGLTACYWLVYPHSVHAVSHQLAAKFCDAGKVVTLGTWADAEAVRVGMEQTAVPHPAPGALPGVGVGS